jgi:predicted lipoprotein with Yx(FWY)xxD motif
VTAGIVAIVVALGGGGAKARPTAAANSAVGLTQTALGSTLVDATGRTLYLFEADKPNSSKLPGAGRRVWPPFIAGGKPQAGRGVLAGQLGTTSQGGGPAQVTYNGHPLYYYVGDRKAGSTTGQGLNQFGALWYVLTANGSANTITAPSGTDGATAPSTGGGYGY